MVLGVVPIDAVLISWCGGAGFVRPLVQPINDCLVQPINDCLAKLNQAAKILLQPRRLPFTSIMYIKKKKKERTAADTIHEQQLASPSPLPPGLPDPDPDPGHNPTPNRFNNGCRVGGDTAQSGSGHPGSKTAERHRCSKSSP